MKIVNIIFLLLILTNCSFDNKTGIWTNNTKDKKIEKKEVKNSEIISASNQKIFDEEKNSLNKINIIFPEVSKNLKWPEEYFNNQNNYQNAFLNTQFTKISKSKKLARGKISHNFYIINNNVFYNDHRGNIYVYSIDKDQVIFKFNFYKKKYKKYKKLIYMTVDEDKIYVLDNLGYAYALNYKNNKLVWAKNYGVPFRSNLKIYNNELFGADLNNTIFAINIFNGEKNWSSNTESEILRNKFINNISIDEEGNLYFLNTSGNLYSFNISTKTMNWFLGLKKGPKSFSNTFDAKPIVINNKKILISSYNQTKLYDSNGAKIWSTNISLSTKPIFINGFIFAFSKTGLLTCLDSLSGEILWAKRILKEENININKKLRKIKNIDSIQLINNKLFLFSKNGFSLEIDYQDGSIISLQNVDKMKSNFLFVKGKMYFINSRNKLSIIN